MRHLIAPEPSLAIAFSQCEEGSSGPEGVPHIADGSFHAPFGDKRALQTVVMVAHKFSLSRTLSIRCGARLLKSLRCATTGAGTVYRTWTTKGRLCTVPVEWTDIHAPDPVVAVGAGRALFRADLLRPLHRLIDEQRARREAAPC